MNKKHLVLVLMLLGTLPVFSQRKYSKDIPTLVNAYRVWSMDKSSKAKQTAFLTAFPKNWYDFRSIYDHYDYRMDGYDRLYKEARNHISALATLNLVDRSALAGTLIDLTYGSCWSADAPNYLQEVLHELMSKEADVFFRELSKRRLAQQFDFWAFYWSGLYENKKYQDEADDLKERMQAQYPDVTRSMSVACEFYNGSATFMTFNNPSCSDVLESAGMTNEKETSTLTVENASSYDYQPEFPVSVQALCLARMQWPEGYPEDQLVSADVQFEIGRDGSLKQIVCHSESPEVKKEMERMTAAFPKALPAWKAGKPVACSCTMQVRLHKGQLEEAAQKEAERNKIVQSEVVYVDPEVEPVPSDGNEAVVDYLYSHLPKDFSGSLIYTFKVKTDGQVADIECVRNSGVDLAHKKQADRIFKEISKKFRWRPMQVHDKFYECKMTLPVRDRLLTATDGNN